MSLPLRIAFVRHGESESNIIQRAQKNGQTLDVEDLVNSRVDWKQRLSETGQNQAKKAHVNLYKIYGDLDYFDSFYVSPFIRARETALLLSGNKLINWEIDDRLSERIWGIYGLVSRQQQHEHFPLTNKLSNDDPWYIRYDGGESLFDVYNRFKNFKEKLWRENSGQNVLIVSHAQFIQSVCYDLEKLLPEDWDKIWEKREYKIPNVGLVEYSRVNPSDSRDIREDFTWRRILYLDNLDESPFGSEWFEFERNGTFSTEEIEKQIDEYPRLLK